MDTIAEEAKTPLLTDREAAAYMKLSPKWGHISIQRWAREGTLRAGKVGDQWRFRRQDLDDFIFQKK